VYPLYYQVEWLQSAYALQPVVASPLLCARLSRCGMSVRFTSLPPVFCHWQAVSLYYAIMGADGSMRGFTEYLSGEPLHAFYQKLHLTSRQPAWLRPIVSALLKVLGQVSFVFVATGPLCELLLPKASVDV
jgi:hypothetical protein